jgi:hypothetical protein
MADFLPRQPRPMITRNFESDFAAGVAHPHDEDAAFLKLGRIPVVGRVHLGDTRTEFRGVRRHPGDLVGRHGDHNVARLDPTPSCRHRKPLVVLAQLMHADSGSNRQLEPGCIGLQVIAHFVLGGESAGRPRKRHPRQAVVAPGGKQAERVPSGSPCVSDPLVGVKDHEGQLTLGEVVPDRETCLTAADDDRVDSLWLAQSHSPVPEAPSPAAPRLLGAPTVSFSCSRAGKRVRSPPSLPICARTDFAA